MSKILLGVLVIVVLGGGAYYYLQSPQESSQEEVNEQETVMEEKEGEGMMEGESAAMERHVVVYSDSGFSPGELTIRKGDTVTFRNESSRDMWPATAIHPSHTVYPGSGIGRCNTSEEESIFDACRRIENGGEFSFVFQEAGDWKYHDHLRATNWGAIIVEE